MGLAAGKIRPVNDRRLLWLLALIPVICACSARDLWAPDEPRYGQVAREMLDRGDWLVPHVNNAPYAEKPPLYYWGAAALSLPFGGVSPVTARLAGALYAFGCVFLLVLLVRRWFDDRAMGVTAAAVFTSMIFVQWVMQRSALDQPLTFFILLTIERGQVWLESGRLGPAVACGAAWIAAILVKGPLGLLFPPAALAAGAIASRTAPSWKNAGWLLVPLVMAGLGLAWLLPALEAGGEAYSDRLLGQIKGRATGGEGHHLRPFYYFVERTPVVSMPWTLHLLAGLLVMVKLRGQPAADRRGLATCAAIGIGGFLFLSAIATKREVYMMPLLPFACTATAYAIHRGLFPRIERIGRIFMIATPIVFGFVLLALPLLEVDAVVRTRSLAFREGGANWSWIGALLPAVLILWGTAYLASNRLADPPQAIRRTALGIGVAFVAISLLFLPKLDVHKSYAPAAEAAHRVAGDGPIYNAGFGQGPKLLWSLDRKETAQIHGFYDLRDAMVVDEPATVVAGAKWWDRLRVEHTDALGGIYETWRALVDGREMVILSNRRPN